MEVYSSECEVDELYLIALQDHDQLIPISDEAYAEELQLQEILFPSFPTTLVLEATASTSASTSQSKREIEKSNDSEESSCKKKVEKINDGEESSGKKKVEENDGEEPSCNGDLVGEFCSICMDKKPSDEFFTSPNCTHSFCIDCTSKYVATRIQENISMVKCPDNKCKGMISPSECSEIVPKEVLERWYKALAESLMLGLGTSIYCPFKECSELILNDEAMVGPAECPSCHRLFCVQCNVAWHQGLECTEFQRLPETDPNNEDVLAIRLAEEKEWRRCPKCFFYVDKESGCLHITCRCSHQFCYRCGSNWSSTHGCH